VTRPTVVGFDLDGTLFDHESAARRAIEAFVNERGWSAPSNVGEQWLEMDRVHFGDHAAGLIDFHEQRRRRMRDLLALVDVDVQDPLALYLDYLPHYEDSWTAFPDVASALAELDSTGLRLAVLTNGRQEQQEAKLARMGVLDRFEVVLAASQLPAFKPSPLAFEALSDAMGVAADSVAYVGDDLIADVAGAQAAGLRPVWLDRLNVGGGPDGVTTIASLAELAVYLE